METTFNTPSAAPRDTCEMDHRTGHSRVMSDSMSLPSFVEYPTDRPFINANIPRRSLDRPVKAFPESNTAAILSALKNLQEKIHRLELERSQAEENLQRLTRESTRHKAVLEAERGGSEHNQGETVVVRDPSELHLYHPFMTPDLTPPCLLPPTELATLLAAAESRCSLLEKQLEYMRKMVRNAESERTAVLKQQASIEKERSDDHADVQAKFEKLDMLEQEYMKLTETQNLAESKIRELEQKLQEEEHQRKLVEDKAAELQTGLEANRILLQSVSPSPARVTKEKKKKTAVKKPLQQPHSHAQPHYRLSLGDVPFVAGTSTTTSHSVRANVQHVLHLMKQHNPQLCNDRVLGGVPLASRSSQATHSDGKKASVCRSCSSSSSSSSCSEELSELLLALQDEFGHMSFEHRELVKQIQDSRTDSLRQHLEQELENLVKRMEGKGEQIAKVRRHQAQMEKLKKESRGQKGRPGRVKVITTVTTRGRAAGPIKVKSGNNSKDSLRLLRDMQSLQTSLRSDQITWSY
ncbi:centrosomal protein of 57 kDa isoform X1 [Conger conger]|uniref:centrosomal protein of 57 kDa isoform X1 n=1 Tax=Conger conger TaxID=82655 RepID=UPI002A5AAB92|nr:centrosomal protein of 57 kDa isoform X1 [Conger conger]